MFSTLQEKLSGNEFENNEEPNSIIITKWREEKWKEGGDLRHSISCKDDIDSEIIDGDQSCQCRPTHTVVPRRIFFAFHLPAVNVPICDDGWE